MNRISSLLHRNRKYWGFAVPLFCVLIPFMLYFIVCSYSWRMASIYFYLLHRANMLLCSTTWTEKFHPDYQLFINWMSSNYYGINKKNLYSFMKISFERKCLENTKLIGLKHKDSELKLKMYIQIGEKNWAQKKRVKLVILLISSLLNCTFLYYLISENAF